MSSRNLKAKNINPDTCCIKCKRMRKVRELEKNRLKREQTIEQLASNKE